MRAAIHCWTKWRAADQALNRFVIVAGVTVLCGVLAAGGATYVLWRVLRPGGGDAVGEELQHPFGGFLEQLHGL